ncbi:MAG: hypothetical protein IZT55_03775 [Anaerolineae bacterium]|nr:hypothetical protein [Anaerolineae bacterium]
MKKTLIAVALVGALALAVGVSGFAYAHGNQPPAFPFDGGGRFADRIRGNMGSGELAEYMHDALAKFLGVTPEELTELHESGATMLTLLEERDLTFEELKEKMDDVREAAVADGIIPEGQMGPRFGEGQQGRFNRRGDADRPGGRMKEPLHQEEISSYMHAAIADILAISVEELDALHESGETLQTLLEARGLTLEEFGTLKSEARESAVAAALADGVITQEQADLILDRLANFNGMGARNNCR